MEPAPLAHAYHLWQAAAPDDEPVEDRLARLRAMAQHLDDLAALTETRIDDTLADLAADGYSLRRLGALLDLSAEAIRLRLRRIDHRKAVTQPTKGTP